MDRDTFIITVYCLIEEHYRSLTAACPRRHGGFVPQLSDVEVITMVLCGEFFKLSRDTDLFAYFRAHYRAFFPAPTDRTLFVRQASNLWQLQAALQRRLVQVSRHATESRITRYWQPPTHDIQGLATLVDGYTGGIIAAAPS
jgi:hypothetical protein